MTGFSRVGIILVSTTLMIAGASPAYAAAPPSTDPGIVLHSLEEKENRQERRGPVISVPEMDETGKAQARKKRLC